MVAKKKYFYTNNKVNLITCGIFKSYTYKTKFIRVGRTERSGGEAEAGTYNDIWIADWFSSVVRSLIYI